MESLLYILSGYILGCVTIKLHMYLNRKPEIKPPRIDGIYMASLVSTTSLGKTTTIKAQIEFNVLGKTDKLIKIGVLSVVCDIAEYNTTSYHEKITNIYNNTWVENDKLTFVSDYNTRERTDTINTIINS